MNDVMTIAKRAGFVLEHFVSKHAKFPEPMYVASGFDLLRFADLIREEERERCCAIVFGQCGSDNVAQRTVDAIRKQP